ncbi:HK97 gp10 family phage protein [Paracoccus saliphilus]|uniref:Bacteriophage HK97-gp10, putative tail-component n=1 Tax=Paracoccus saliphilus TaxID=405559 RepID=A0AA46A7A6_9RHOB|nr:HK97 gp10 family phage protein [Paracoccus saliphilus]WCR04754.1 HK97 gp10 family phage protein [Paracoccus saliphilus]SIT10972.1 Bacteriophage HK97-gp10, putative tail-component [Paracoccus saliphilus]
MAQRRQYVIGADDIARKFERAKIAAAEKLRPALVKSGEELAADMRQLAESSRRSGDLIESIHVTGPGETTPAHSADGGQRKAGEYEVLVTSGDSDTRHSHLVEGGTDERQHKDGTPTGRMPAKPFFNPAYRLNRTRIRRRLQRITAPPVT